MNTLLFALLGTIVCTYGVVESKLCTALRVAWLLLFPRKSHLLHGLLHCAYCVGWWIATGWALLLCSSWVEMLHVPACYITLLLLSRTLTGRELFLSPYRTEFEAVHHES